MSETAGDWFNKADALRNEGKYTDPKKAIEYLNKAIRLNRIMLMLLQPWGGLQFPFAASTCY